tara:strand:+ start:794 stop:1753 length:960 start_codon:yes stop_codon:yes gene_type:complete
MSILKSKKKVFFHFGYPKTATVFLQKNFFSKHDMINFFCRNHSKNDLIIFSVIDQIIELNNLDFSKKKNIFKEIFKNINFDSKKINLISDQNILCHKFRKDNNIYRTFDRINKIFVRDDVELYIFFSVRKQSDALLSIYRQFYHTYFSKMLPDLNNFFSINSENDIKEILESLKYNKILLHLSNIFGENKIKLFSFELLKSNRSKFLFYLCEYLNIHTDLIQKMNSLQYENKFSLKKVSLLKSIRYNLSNWPNLMSNFHLKIFRFLKFLLFEYIQGKIRLSYLSKISFNESCKEKIINYYNDDNLQLKKKTNIDYLNEK